MCVYDKYMYVCIDAYNMLSRWNTFINSIVNNTNQKHKNLHKKW